MKVAVTGAAGLQGSWLCHALNERGHDVVGIDNRDITADYVQDACTRVKLNIAEDEEGLFDALDGCSTVFHLAARMGSHAQVAGDPSIALENAKIDRALLMMISHLSFFSHLLPEGRPIHFIYASSGCVYPAHARSNDSSKSEELYFEEDAPAGPALPLPGDCSYGTQKIVTEFAARTQSGFGSTCLRMFNVYGEGAREGNLVYDLMQKVKKTPVGEPVSTYGFLNARRPLLHVYDAAEAYIAAMERSREFLEHASINIGAAETLSIREILETMVNLCQPEARSPSKVKGQNGAVSNKAPSIERAEQLLGWKPKITVHAGLQLSRGK